MVANSHVGIRAVLHRKCGYVSRGEGKRMPLPEEQILSARTDSSSRQILKSFKALPPASPSTIHLG